MMLGFLWCLGLWGLEDSDVQFVLVSTVGWSSCRVRGASSGLEIPEEATQKISESPELQEAP